MLRGADPDAHPDGQARPAPRRRRGGCDLAALARDDRGPRRGGDDDGGPFGPHPPPRRDRRGLPLNNPRAAGARTPTPPEARTRSLLGTTDMDVRHGHPDPAARLVAQASGGRRRGAVIAAGLAEEGGAAVRIGRTDAARAKPDGALAAFAGRRQVVRRTGSGARNGDRRGPRRVRNAVSHGAQTPSAPQFCGRHGFAGTASTGMRPTIHRCRARAAGPQPEPAPPPSAERSWRARLADRSSTLISSGSPPADAITGGRSFDATPAS